MRILVDICVFDLRNKGNIAMLESAVHRLQDFWPDAAIEVLTVGPLLLKYYLPDCIPVNPYGSSNSRSRTLLQRFFQYIPASIWRQIFIIRDRISRYKLNRESANAHLELNNATQQSEPSYITTGLENTPDIAEISSNESAMPYMGFLDGIDLFVGAGGHYLSDPCKDSALQTLDRVEAAIQRGIPTVLVGQGMGPFEDQALFNKVKQVLPKIDLILIREKNYAPRFLDSIGVSKDRVILTGDDAIEMAYTARKNWQGTDIGVGARVASSSEVSADHILETRHVLGEAAHKHRAKFMPLPISDSIYESVTDAQVIKELLEGYLDKDWQETPFLFPSDTINFIGNCRIVLTGAYHPAVFALAQGIPVICLAKSAHYSNKLSGLADIFGVGCEVIMFDDDKFQEKLAHVIDHVWTHATELREKILESARSQIEWGHAGYRRIFDLVKS